MILSMTGFGHSVIDTESGQLSATIRSVNSRYLDIKIRGLHIEPKVEQNIRQLLSKAFAVGIGSSLFSPNISYNEFSDKVKNIK